MLLASEFFSYVDLNSASLVLSRRANHLISGVWMSRSLGLMVVLMRIIFSLVVQRDSLNKVGFN
jgi:hypothetical protein